MSTGTTSTGPAPPRDFLRLTAEDQAELYSVAAQDLGRDPRALEKDVWVCWTLEALFNCEGLPSMAFKGGTSLSKVYDAIQRFSEDIDVTMDCRELGGDDPFDEKLSRKGRDRVDEALRAQVRATSMQVAFPHLERERQRQGVDASIIADKDGEEIHVRYPTVFAAPQEPSYMLDVVKIEFGGRNLTEPCESHTVRPYVASAPGMEQLGFPNAEVDVLCGERTFWEKFTLAHEAVQRAEVAVTAARMARHWYDLAKLHRHEIGARSYDRLDILRDVVRVKERFYRRGNSNYDLCLRGQATIIPTGLMMDNLWRDYQAMVDSQMLEAAPPTFAEIVDEVTELQVSANALIGASVDEAAH